MMKPGIYSLGREEYNAIDAVRFSHLKYMARSPLHFRAAATGDVKATKSMRLGGIAHALTLEPDSVWEDYALFAPVNKDGSPKKKVVFNGGAYDEFCEANPGKEIVKPDELERGTNIAHSILTYGPAKRYLAKGEAELALVWVDQKTGLLCKARVDWLSKSVAHCFVELKTSPDVNQFVFRTRFAKMLYHVQTAWYLDGYKAITGFEGYGKCIAVESVEPHDVIVYDLAEVVDTGRETARELLDKVAECKLSKQWPGQAGETEQAMTLPKWLEDDDEDLGEVGLDWEAAS